MYENTLFLYGYDHGGLGDFIKTLKIYIEYSIKMDNKILIHIKNDCVKNMIIIKDKYRFDSTKDTYDHILTPPYIISNKIFPPVAGKLGVNVTICDISLFDYIDFNNIIYQKHDYLMNKYNLNSYNCIHIRRGDMYGNITFPSTNDDRSKGKNIDSIIDNIIKENDNMPLVLVSDHLDTKNRLKKKYNNIIIFDVNILHLDFYYTRKIKHNDEDIINNMTEFLTLCKANTIYSIGKSGFSYVASWFYNNKILFY